METTEKFRPTNKGRTTRFRSISQSKQHWTSLKRFEQRVPRTPVIACCEEGDKQSSFTKFSLFELTETASQSLPTHSSWVYTYRNPTYIERSLRGKCKQAQGRHWWITVAKSAAPLILILRTKRDHLHIYSNYSIKHSPWVSINPKSPLKS